MGKPLTLAPAEFNLLLCSNGFTQKEIQFPK